MVGILLLAGALRCWRLSWGIANGYVFPDEYWYSSVGASFVPLTWQSFLPPRLYYPTLFDHLVGGTVALAYRLGYPQHPPNPLSTESVLIARGISAGLSILTVWIVGHLAARLYGRRAGVVAALLLAVAPLHVVYGPSASTDTLLTMCFALAIWAGYRLALAGAAWRAALTGGLAGCALASKYTGLAAIAILGWAVAEQFTQRRSLRWALRLTVVGLATFGGAFAIGCPACLIRWDLARDAIAMHSAFTMNPAFAKGFLNNHLVPLLGWYGRPYLFQLVALFPFTLGWPLYGACLVGVAVALRRRTIADRVLFAAAIPYFVVIGRAQVCFPRYLLPLVPALVIWAARAVCGLRPRACIALVGGIAIYSGVLSITLVEHFSTQQHKAVADWIAEAAAHRDGRGGGVIHVAVPSLPLDYFGIAHQLQLLRRPDIAYLPVTDGHWLDQRPEMFVLPEFYDVAIRRDRPGSPEARELDSLTSGRAGYRAAARWPAPGYLQRSLYTYLDPGLGCDIWLGFTVFVRPDVFPG
ncbi:MAG: ArnT family glycosyltransferase [Candidatus Binatia bacterium]